MKKVEVFGSGCAKCKQAEKIMKMAANELGIQVDLQKVTDLSDIMAKGISITPAVAVDGKIIVSGKIPSLDDAKRFLND